MFLAGTSRHAPYGHDVIKPFRGRTGVPMALHTFFNENEPAVCAPAGALECFLRRQMDVLVFGDATVSRPGAATT
jgi:carbamoyltransferase